MGVEIFFPQPAGPPSVAKAGCSGGRGCQYLRVVGVVDGLVLGTPERDVGGKNPTLVSGA